MSMTTYHILYGRHSNIPACCIDFFINRWNHENQYGDIVHKFCPVEYIPCPKCFAEGNFNKLRICAIECKQECSKIYWDKYGRH